MASKVEIVNIALTRLGQKPVANLDDNNNEARVSLRVYDLVLDYALEAFPWQFAKRRRLLSLLTDTPPTNWDYAYAYPTDCVAIRSMVVDGTEQPTLKASTVYEVASDGSNRIILSNVADLEAVYTARIEDPNQWPASFQSAVAWAIAAECGISILGVNPAIIERAGSYYRQVIMEAARNDAGQQFRGPEQNGEILGAMGITL